MSQIQNEVIESTEAPGLKFNKESFAALIATVGALTERVQALESKNQTSSTKREMTVEDARAVILGAQRELSHKEAAAALGLSYGQVYSARGGYTFKAVTAKEMKEAGLPSLWEKK
jgi:DNA-directed RNA polymerase specialized sigma24 family protein